MRRPRADRRPAAMQAGLLVLIRAYQLSFSALVGRQCRYLPSCSDYAAEAIRRHGAWPGLWMGAARLCRCHPFGGSGFDPVPITCEAADRWRPWRFGRWRMPPDADQERARSSAASP